MYKIESSPMSEEFFECWKAAVEHLDSQVDGGIKSWLRAHPYPPFLEHLSFRLGNQLFFIRVEDCEEALDGPGSVQGLLSVAENANGHACLMRMERRWTGGWSPQDPGWGLVNAITKEPIHPVELISGDLIEMTDWELQDFAVEVVRASLEEDGFEIMSWQPNPKVDPSIWFVGASGGPEWVVVRADCGLMADAVRPANWEEIALSCAPHSSIGHFAHVTFVSADGAPNLGQGDVAPLFRGRGVQPIYSGFEDE